MNSLIKKLHMYTGLLNFSVLLVFGITGLVATLQPAPDRRARPQPETRFEPFTVPPEITDHEVAERVRALLQPPLAGPAPPDSIRRDAESNLTMDFYSVNGLVRVTVMEKGNRLRIEKERNHLSNYFTALHATLSRNAAGRGWPVRLWGYYNEFAIWSLLGMACSGVYLWLSSRPRYRPAQYAFIAGCSIFLALFVWR